MQNERIPSTRNVFDFEDKKVVFLLLCWYMFVCVLIVLIAFRRWGSDNVPRFHQFYLTEVFPTTFPTPPFWSLPPIIYTT